MAYTSTSTVSPTVTSALLGKNTRAGGNIPFACAASRSKNYQKLVHAIHRKWSKNK